MDNFPWNHCVAVVLFVCFSFFLCFATMCSRNVAVANGFLSTYTPMQCGIRFRDAFFIVFNNRFLDEVSYRFST